MGYTIIYFITYILYNSDSQEKSNHHESLTKGGWKMEHREGVVKE